MMQLGPVLVLWWGFDRDDWTWQRWSYPHGWRVPIFRAWCLGPIEVRYQHRRPVAK